jgi:hypothetical protein
LSSRIRHELDRAGVRLRERFAYRPARRRVPSERWRWSDERAQVVEQGVRELLADAARHHQADRLEPRAARLLEQARDLLGAPAAAGESSACAWCGGPMPEGLRPEARFCKKACRQASSRARLKDRPARSGSPPPVTCSWCDGPMPDGLRAEARFCAKSCRQASSRFSLGMRSIPGAEPLGPGDTSPALEPPASATRRRRPPREVLDDVSRAMRFCYADPPYPGKAGYYPEAEEVDHRALVQRLAIEGPDGWALSTSATALAQVLALCPPGVRVCSWHRAVRPTRSKRPISAWEPLIVSGGRELPTDGPQQIRDALAYGGRYRRYPGAMVGMKPPQFAAWMFAQLGARPGDQLVDLYPGSGAVGEAWRRYSGQPPLSLPAAPSPHCRACLGHSQPCRACVAAAGDPAPEQFVLGPGVAEVRRCAGCGRVYGAYHAGRALCFLMEAPGRRQVERCVRCAEPLTDRSTVEVLVDGRHVAGVSERAPLATPPPPRTYDRADVCCEHGLVCPVNGARCESVACLDAGCTAPDVGADQEQAA